MEKQTKTRIPRKMKKKSKKELDKASFNRRNYFRITDEDMEELLKCLSEQVIETNNEEYEWPIEKI